MPTMPLPYRANGTPARRERWARGGLDLAKTERLRGRKGVAVRAAYLAREPLCRLCATRGRVSAATEVDHITPLSRGGGNEEDNLQPLCFDCHEAKSATERAGQHRPEWLPSPAIPVNIVWGPPAGGKSTFVAAHAAPGDVVLDLDVIVEEIAGEHGHQVEDPAIWAAARWHRNQRIAALSRARAVSERRDSGRDSHGVASLIHRGGR